MRNSLLAHRCQIDASSQRLVDEPERRLVGQRVQADLLTATMLTLAELHLALTSTIPLWHTLPAGRLSSRRDVYVDEHHDANCLPQCPK